MTLRMLTTAGALTALVLAAGSAQASVTTIGSQAAFSAAGATAQNTNFDSVTVGFLFPGSPYAVGDLTFVAGSLNLIGGTAPGSSYNTARSLFTDQFVQGTTIQSAGAYDLFAVNAGNFFEAGPSAFLVTTNLGNYSFNPAVSDANNLGALTFIGFRAGPGEYFTSVNYSGEHATGVTDVQLGVAGSAPEPATWGLMVAGFAGLGVALRRRARPRAAC